MTAAKSVVFGSSRSTLYPLGLGTSIQALPSQYCAFHAFGTLTPAVEVTLFWSRQKSSSMPDTRTGSFQVYCSHRVAGCDPDQVPHSSLWAPPVYRIVPLFTALTLFHGAVYSAVGVASGATFAPRVAASPCTVTSTELEVSPSLAVSRST